MILFFKKNLIGLHLKIIILKVKNIRHLPNTSSIKLENWWVVLVGLNSWHARKIYYSENWFLPLQTHQNAFKTCIEMDANAHEWWC